MHGEPLTRALPIPELGQLRAHFDQLNDPGSCDGDDHGHMCILSIRSGDVTREVAIPESQYTEAAASKQHDGHYA